MANRRVLYSKPGQRRRRRFKGGGSGRLRGGSGGGVAVQDEINKAILQGQKDLAKRIDDAIRPPKIRDAQERQPLPEVELPALPPVPVPPAPLAPQSQFYDYTDEVARGASRRRAARRRGLRATKYAGETGGYQPVGGKSTLG